MYFFCIFLSISLIDIEHILTLPWSHKNRTKLEIPSQYPCQNQLLSPHYLLPNSPFYIKNQDKRFFLQCTSNPVIPSKTCTLSVSSKIKIPFGVSTYPSALLSDLLVTLSLSTTCKSTLQKQMTTSGSEDR